MRVFLSYRRSDTGAVVGRFSDKLLTRIAIDNVFFDADSIERGEHFERRILDAVDQADWVLVFIGSDWLTVGEPGAPRIHDPNDYVRREVQLALALGKKVMPILVDGTRLPDAEALPEDIQALVKHQVAVLRHVSFHSDADTIIASLIPAERPEQNGPCTFCIGLARSKDLHTATPGSGLLHQFQDDTKLPRMVLLPRGQFTMAGRTINSTKVIAVSQSPITVAEFEAFVRETGHACQGTCYLWSGTHWTPCDTTSFRDAGFHQDGHHPAVCISWHDAIAYTAWASELTAESYRLCSEAEWEFAARAGIRASVWWASGQAHQFVHSKVPNRPNEGTIPIEMLAPNAWGLRHVLGNVQEWTADTWIADLSKVPAVVAPYRLGSRTLRVVRGAAWNLDEAEANLMYRAPLEASHRYNNTGFRIVRDIQTA